MIHLSYLPHFLKNLQKRFTNILMDLKVRDGNACRRSVQLSIIVRLEAMLREVDRTLYQILSRTYESSQGKEKSLS